MVTLFLLITALIWKELFTWLTGSSWIFSILVALLGMTLAVTLAICMAILKPKEKESEYSYFVIIKIYKVKPDELDKRKRKHLVRLYMSTARWYNAIMIQYKKLYAVLLDNLYCYEKYPPPKEITWTWSIYWKIVNFKR